MILIPQGSRVIGVDIQPVTELEERAKAAGISVVIAEKNIPLPTSMIVHAVGPDPLVQEMVRVGDTVLFSRHAGQMVMLEGREYRSLEYREISHVIRQEEPSASTLSSPDSADPGNPPTQQADPQLNPLHPLSSQSEKG